MIQTMHPAKTLHDTHSSGIC